ncbi:MAG TPA: outer membrane protein assembly factor BamA [Acidobacteriota bacterium]|nr:outer membrane protein assembly factor BamA [Acidobacteriota bacterium]
MTHKRFRIGSFLLSLLAAVLLCAPALSAPNIPQDQPPQRIEEVLVVGNRRIPESTVRFYIQTKENDPYNEDQILRDYRSLLRTSFFEDATVKRQPGETGVIIIFEVSERPLIREIEYEGLSSFKESDILERFRDMRVGMTVDTPFDESKIPLARRALKQLLDSNGRPLGRVEVNSERITSSTVKLTFVIDEGPKVRIGKIDFRGNEVVEDQDLRQALELNKEKGLSTAFKSTDMYIEDKLEFDVQTNMMEEYRSRGYIFAKAGEPDVEIVEGPRGWIWGFRKTKQQYYIEVPIEEGDQYTVGKFNVDGAENLPPEFVRRVYPLQEGSVLNMTALRQANEDLEKFYSERGYLDMTAVPDIDPDPEAKTADINITISEGNQYIVDRIEFAGNSRTRDKVLRREFVLEEQQTFNGRLLDISVTRLNQLGFFEPIEEEDYEVVKKPQEGEVDVVVNVKERSSQSIGFTGGISGISGSFFGVNYSTNNFRGKGQRIEVSLLTGTRTALFNFSMTDPYFLDTRTSVGWSVFRQRSRFDTFAASGFLVGNANDAVTLFERINTGFSVSASRPFWRWSRIGLSYSLTTIDIDDIDPSIEAFARGQLIGFTPGGDPDSIDSGLIRSEVTPSFTFNSKNGFFEATRGRSLTVRVPFAGGPLGGTFNIIRPIVEFQQFIPDRWLSGGRHTFAFRVLGQHVRPYGNLESGQEMQVPFFERIFIGGEFNLRGFDIRSVSPIAISRTPRVDTNGNPVLDPGTGLPLITESLIAIGGDTSIVLTGEYRVPIAGPLSVAGFVDVGTSTILDEEGIQVFGSDTFVDLVDGTNGVWRMSTGAEIQFMMPVVNQPFRLIMAYNPFRLQDELLLGGRAIPVREPSTNVKFTVGWNF